ncbi:hypothetical protein ACFPM1_03635 [Halorubrum rubrum]|uniref:Uncharacterized protein n=1 Tax=Halorubrum rubrum TaxID=1126240 RepID=A0ABD5QZ78_9EURY|nr:hypothetical protein [Halorubrum rubrum]
MKGENDDNTDFRRSGEWLGELEGIGIRDPGPDADGPIVEFHGSESMAAVEVTSEEFVDKLSEAAAEVQLALDDQEDGDLRTDGGEEVDGAIERLYNREPQVRCGLCRERYPDLRPCCVENRVEIPLMCDGCYVDLRDAGRLDLERDAEVFGYADLV